MDTRTATTTSGLSVAYDVQGEGPPVVLVPGVLFSRSSWHETGYVAHLQDRFRVITVDPMGHGDSDKSHDASDYGPDQLVDHTIAVLDAEGIEQAAIWGFSRGGFIAALVGWAAPERARTVVLGSTPMTGRSSWPDDAVEAMSRGDWPTFWEVFPVSVPDPVRGYLEEINDPVAIAAAVVGGSSTFDWRPFAPATMGYVGNGEDFAELNRQVATTIGLPMAVLPTGGHADTFRTATAVLPVIEPYL